MSKPFFLAPFSNPYSIFPQPLSIFFYPSPFASWFSLFIFLCGCLFHLFFFLSRSLSPAAYHLFSESGLLFFWLQMKPVSRRSEGTSPGENVGRPLNSFTVPVVLAEFPTFIT